MNKPMDETMGNQQGSLNLYAVPGYENYFCSDSGELFSTKRNKTPISLTCYEHKARGKKMYLRVKLGGRLHLVHRLVASVNIGRVLLRNEVVNHIDGNTLNNNFCNLEVVTHKENVAHAVKNGLYCSGGDWYAARKILEPSTTIESTQKCGSE